MGDGYNDPFPIILLRRSIFMKKLFALAACIYGLIGGQVMAEDTKLARATFAGGCFWCMEKPFDIIDGVKQTVSGYTNGHIENPSYKQVSSGGSGHIEAMQVTYDPEKVSYETLLYTFWRNIDPLNARGQFCDFGEQYTTAIFYHDDIQKQAAEKSLNELKDSDRFDKDIATKLIPASKFYPAETYHQDYYKKNPIRYGFYRRGCGRDARLEEVWGDESGGH